MNESNDHNQEKTVLEYGYPLLYEAGSKKEVKGLRKRYAKKELVKIGPFWALSDFGFEEKNKNQLDFLIPDSSVVLAAQDGVVIRVEDRHDKSGSRWDMDQYLNFITIKHLPNEFSQYCHLKPHSAMQHGTKIGRVVRRGQLIARVGRTGRLSDYHNFSFTVFKLIENSVKGHSYESLKVKFISEPKKRWFWIR